LCPPPPPQSKKKKKGGGKRISRRVDAGGEREQHGHSATGAEPHDCRRRRRPAATAAAPGDEQGEKEPTTELPTQPALCALHELTNISTGRGAPNKYKAQTRCDTPEPARGPTTRSPAPARSGRQHSGGFAPPSAATCAWVQGGAGAGCCRGLGEALWGGGGGGGSGSWARRSGGFINKPALALGLASYFPSSCSTRRSLRRRIFPGQRAAPITALDFSAWGVAPHVDTGAVKSGPFCSCLFGSCCCCHSLFPLVCRLQPHNVRPKSTLGKQDIGEASFRIP
jgi:hypothetical protein